jgi:hypothetical protein
MNCLGFSEARQKVIGAIINSQVILPVETDGNTDRNLQISHIEFWPGVLPDTIDLSVYAIWKNLLPPDNSLRLSYTLLPQQYVAKKRYDYGRGMLQEVVFKGIKSSFLTKENEFTLSCNNKFTATFKLVMPEDLKSCSMPLVLPLPPDNSGLLQFRKKAIYFLTLGPWASTRTYFDFSNSDFRIDSFPGEHYAVTTRKGKKQTTNDKAGIKIPREPVTVSALEGGAHVKIRIYFKH